MELLTGIKKKIDSKSNFFSVTENQIAILLILIGIGARVAPIIINNRLGNNFAPIAAIALFAGVYLKRKYAIILPLIIMVISDLFIGIHNLIFLTWGSFILIGLIGLWVRENKKVINVAIGTLTGSFLFFFITNFGVWALTPLYQKTAQGLVLCYVMAIPFFRNTLLGDVFFVTILFGAMKIAKYFMKNKVPKLLVSRQ